MLQENAEMKETLRETMLEIQDAGYQATKVSRQETQERLLAMYRKMEDMLVRMDDEEMSR